MIDLTEVGATARLGGDGAWEVSIGVYLPNITFTKGYRLKVRIIHELDQYIRGIEPREFWMTWQEASPLGLWTKTVPLVSDPASHFGDPGQYLYRFQLLRGDQPLTFWFSDPFARAVGPGTLSAFEVDPGDEPFTWTDADFRVPAVDDMVVYELNVREFNRDFQGVVNQLDYLHDLGVNTLELMPVTNVREDVEWGYTPLGFFAPDDRMGGVAGMKLLVNACHEHGIAVILDAVYAHAHPEYPYNLVYDVTREDNPMMGYFAGEFFSRPGTDYRKRFTADYFFEVNKYWLEEFHVDGFRYDYVPGIYEGDPTGPGYPELVFRTAQHAKTLPKFQAPRPIIQCAEHLPDPVGILSQTYSNCCWQNGLLHRARDMAKYQYVSEHIAHLLDPQLQGYPTEYHNPATGDSMAVAPFQYLESHDHRRFINTFGELETRDLIGEAYGNRDLFYKVQPYIIALYTAKGIPMLWQGGEFLENWGVPDSGVARNLYERPLHWEYFYDIPGRALVRLHRIMGSLRRSHRALGARRSFYYHDVPEHRQRRVIAYRREAPGDPNPSSGPPTAPEHLLVALNFSDSPATVQVPFARAGRWLERIDGIGILDVAGDEQWMPIVVPSNYGVVYEHT
jgi:1,4-alpha-glucan branching enzyme